MLLFADGFDHYNTTAMMGRKWETVSSLSIGTGRFGRGKTYGGYGNETPTATKSIAAKATIITGFARIGAPVSTQAMVTFIDGATAQCGVAMYPDGTLFRFKNAIATSPVVLGKINPNAWNYIEVKVTIGTTTSNGAMEVRVNGAVISAETGLNLKQTANATLSSIQYRPMGAGFIDDLYICDTTGAINNDFLGEIEVRTQIPAGDSAVQFTRNTGATNASAVDDAAVPDDDTTYVEDATANDQDLYTMVGMAGTAPATVKAVCVTSCIKNTDASAKSAANLLKSNATQIAGATRALGTSYAMYQDIYETDPNGGGAWTAAAADAALAGFKVVA